MVSRSAKEELYRRSIRPCWSYERIGERKTPLSSPPLWWREVNTIQYKYHSLNRSNTGLWKTRPCYGTYLLSGFIVVAISSPGKVEKRKSTAAARWDVPRLPWPFPVLSKTSQIFVFWFIVSSPNLRCQLWTNLMHFLFFNFVLDFLYAQQVLCFL